MKYEEDVEDGGERWSKPHVASLSLHSLFELRSSLLMGAVMLDMDAYHITQVAGKAHILVMFKSSYLLVINIHKIVVETSILYRPISLFRPHHRSAH